MRKFYILLFAMCALNAAHAQSCLPQGITFSTQAQIDSFQVNYPNCTQIEGDVTFMGSDITNLNGLSVVTSVGGTVSIYINGLDSLTGLNNLTSIGGGLIIQNNDSLVNLEGLENLNIISGGIWFRYNHSLKSLTGLDNVTAFGTLIWIEDNDSLCFCSIQSICNYLVGSGTAWIDNNASGCDSKEEVLMACGVGLDDSNKPVNQFYISPNPSFNVLTITTQALQAKIQLTMSNLTGQELINCQITGPKTQLDISKLSAGVYIIRLGNENSVQIMRLMKE